MSPGPLDGLKVLDLTRLLPGGFATLMLADLGADVVKIEEPGKGDYICWMLPMVGDTSAHHIALNRNKRSMTLNLKSERGVALFLSLSDGADVVIESFRPGVMTRLGVGSDVLTARNPRLVYCALSGYGQDGPRAHVVGHDVNYIGYAGVLSIIGEEGGRPVIPGVQVGDLAGGMSAAIAILAALLKRVATGRGDVCDISMMDAAASWLSIHGGSYAATNEVPQLELTTLTGAYPCYRVYPAADGWITVGALEPHFWSALCDALERPDLRDDGYATGARRNEVIEDLEKVFSQRTRAEWMEKLGDLDVCVGPVNDFAEAFADPQLRHRDMFVDADVPGVGPWTLVGNPIRLSEAPGEVLRLPPPKLGEHTGEILADLGLDAARIDELRSSGAV